MVLQKKIVKYLILYTENFSGGKSIAFQYTYFSSVAQKPAFLIITKLIY